MKFTPPFQVQDGVIYDREGRKVKLWGVNYYAPFNHNYYNIAELVVVVEPAVDRTDFGGSGAGVGERRMPPV